MQFEMRKTGQGKGTVHLSGRWRSHVIECENSAQEVRGETTGASPARNRSELVVKALLRVRFIQLIQSESGTSVTIAGTTRLASSSENVS